MVEQNPEYDDFQLRIDRDAEGCYRVLALAPGGRTGRGTFQSPITGDELDEFVRRVGLARRRRGSQDERMGQIRSFGSQLFDALMRDQVASVYQAAREAAHVNGRGLRITLRLSGAPELMQLPWEFLYRRPRFLSQSIRTPLVRSLDVETARRPQQVRLPLRILGIVSSPAGYVELDAGEERRKLEKALSRLHSEGLVELHWLERATLGELGRRISEPDEIHILHYIGHGAYDESSEGGILVLETPQGRAHDVSGEDIGAMLQDEESLRLVVLNSCEGARTSRFDPFSGVATSLIEFDIPAVIGMQFEITDEAAIAFSDSLYTALAQGLPVDAALAPARRAIVGALKEPEFGTPVLFLRAGDAHLFDIKRAPTEIPSPVDRADVASESLESSKQPTAKPMETAHFQHKKVTETQSELPQPQASKQTHWVGVVEYRRTAWVKGLTTIKLSLDNYHEITFTFGWKMSDTVEIDGELAAKIYLPFTGAREFAVLDGDAQRKCVVNVSSCDYTGAWAWLWRIESCVVDGVNVPLRQGEIHPLGWRPTS